MFNQYTYIITIYEPLFLFFSFFHTTYLLYRWLAIFASRRLIQKITLNAVAMTICSIVLNRAVDTIYVPLVDIFWYRLGYKHIHCW